MLSLFCLFLPVSLSVRAAAVPTSTPYPYFPVSARISSTVIVYPEAQTPPSGSLQGLTYYGGFTGKIRVGGTLTQLAYQYSAWPPCWTAAGISVEPRFAQVNSGVFISYVLTSTSLDNLTADFAITGDMGPFPADGPDCYNFPNFTGYACNRGQSWVGWRYRNYPLITDASTYFLGTTEYQKEFVQLEQDVMGVGDVRMAFSYQNLSFAPGATKVLTQYVYGGVGSRQPVLSLPTLIVPRVVGSGAPIEVRGTATAERGGNLSLMIVFNGEPWTIVELANVESGVEFSAAFNFEAFGFNRTGSVALEFYAIDAYGGVSATGTRYQTLVVAPTVRVTMTHASTKPATDTPTPSQSPLASRSPPASLTGFPSRSRSPTISPFPAIAMRVTSTTTDNFRLYGELPGGTVVGLTYSPYTGIRTKYRINGAEQTIVNAQPHTYMGVTVRTSVTTIGPIAIVQFTVVNEHGEDRNVSIGIGNDNMLNGATGATVATLPEWEGIHMYEARGAATVYFFCRNYPFTVDTDAYWYGADSSLASSFFAMVATSTLSYTSTWSALTASWLDRTIQPGETQRFSLVVSWKPPKTPPSLSITLDDPQDSYNLLDDVPLVLTGTVTEGDGDDIGIYGVVDGDLSAFHQLETDLSSEPSFTTQISLRSWAFSSGSHVISFYAIDSEGSISRDVNQISITVLAPTPTPAMSAIQSRTLSPPSSAPPTRSPTASPRPNPTPEATSTPFPYIPLRVGTSYFRFEGWWPERPQGAFAISSGNSTGIVTFDNTPGSATQDIYNWQSNTYQPASGPVVIETRAVAVEAAGILMYKVKNQGSAASHYHLGACHALQIQMPNIYGQNAGYNNPRCTGTDDWTGFRTGEHGLMADLHMRQWPFTTDVDTYYYGSATYGAVRQHYMWTMTTETAPEVPSSYTGWSWQNRVIEPGETQVLSMVTVFGLGSTPPELTLDLSGMPSTVFWEDQLHLVGVVEDEDSPKASLVLVYDDDNFSMIVLPQQVLTGVQFDVTFRLLDAGIREGVHTVTVYAVDITGEVSNSVSFSLTSVAPTPIATQTPSVTRTVSKSPDATITASAQMSRTPSDSPTPSPSPYVDIAMSVSSDVDSKTNFRLHGVRHSDPGNPIDVSTRGFGTQYVVNGTTGLLTRMRPVQVSGVEIATSIEISSTTAVVQFQILNTLAEVQNVSLSLYTTLLVGGYREVYISKREDGTGLRVVGGLSHLQLFCRQYPMVVDVDSYWFGRSEDLESSYFGQVADSVFDGNDGALSFSWHNRSIPARTRQTLSLVLAWGEGVDLPEIDLGDSTLPTEDDVIGWDDNISFGGTIDVSSGGDIENTVIYIVVDGQVVGEVVPDSSGKFKISFTPSSLQLSGGIHQFQVFAIDAGGAIAPIATFTTVIAAPTAAQSQTAPPSQSPVATPTASASWGEIIDVPWYAEDDLESADSGVSSVTIGRIFVGVGLPVAVILIAGFAYLIYRYRLAVRADMTQTLRSNSQMDSSGTGMGV